jgi:hypothetical protein
MGQCLVESAVSTALTTAEGKGRKANHIHSLNPSYYWGVKDFYQKFLIIELSDQPENVQEESSEMKLYYSSMKLYYSKI